MDLGGEANWKAALRSLDNFCSDWDGVCKNGEKMNPILEVESKELAEPLDGREVGEGAV